MNEKRTSVFSNGLIWFGAGVSLAEILTGTYFAPLGFGKAMAAILWRCMFGSIAVWFLFWSGWGWFWLGWLVGGGGDRRADDVCRWNDWRKRA